MCLSNIMTGGASLFILRYERLSFEKKNRNFRLESVSGSVNDLSKVIMKKLPILKFNADDCHEVPSKLKHSD